MFDSPEARFALEAVRLATQLVKQVQHGMVTPALTKGDKSPVTVADFAAQAVVGRLLSQQRPGDVLVGEEDAADLRTAGQRAAVEQVAKFVSQALPNATPGSVCDWIDVGRGQPGARYWTLDPVDGTKGFLRGEQYAVALALIENGRVQLGVLGCPNLTDGWRQDGSGPGSLVVAARGQGTWTRPVAGGELQRLHVSQRTAAAEARVLRSVESGHTNVDQMGDLIAALGATAEPVLMDSQAKYAVLAAGQGDLLFRLISSAKPDYKECIWDQAAGSIVVEEAGGTITDLDGKPLDFSCGRRLTSNRGVAASNGRLHETALGVLRRVGA